MPAFSETGHAKNVANFQTLITFVEGYGTAYNPSKSTLKIGALNTLLADAQRKLADVIPLNTAYNNVVNDRIIEFSTLKPLATRVINALQATDANKETIKDAKTINRKMQGGRVSKPLQPVDPNATAPKTISSSQQSYDQQIQHFTSLIELLTAESTYTPNETDLTIANLNAKKEELKAKNNAIAAAYISVSNARIARNVTLYNIETGIVATASDIKKYIKSVFGANSAQYNQVSGLQINKIRT